MMSNTELQRTVEDELKWNPSLDASHIGVTVKDGIVTLTGYVVSYFQKKKAESLVKHLAHVKAVVDELELKLPNSAKRGDLDLAESALEVLKLNVLVPAGKILVTVDNGWISLDGVVDWQYQRTAAEDAIKYLTGVRGISNNVTVKSTVHPADVKLKIQNALIRNAQIDASHITVDTANGKATLAGHVRSWIEREQAEAAAWSAPGISKVENRISIAP
ncbi:osmotically-inducible protein OsmY [Oxalobacteraceae bacterium GrIS 2.11]